LPVTIIHDIKSRVLKIKVHLVRKALAVNFRFFAALLLMISLDSAFALNGPAQSLSQETHQFLTENSICKRALEQVAQTAFNWRNVQGIPTVRVSLDIEDLIGSLRLSGLDEAQVEKVHESFIPVVQEVKRNSVLMDTVRTLLTNEPPYDRVNAVFCAGLSCNLSNRSVEAVNFPFNYAIVAMSKVNGTDTSKLLPQLPAGIPHPNGGMNRVEFILLDKVNPNNPKELNQWIAKFFKDFSVYASHRILSEWIAKNNLLSRIGQETDPLFRKYIRVYDGIIFIDPILYRVFMVSRKFDAQLTVEQIRIDMDTSIPTSKKESLKVTRAIELRKQALTEIMSSDGNDGVSDFQLTELNIFETGRILGGQFSSFNQRINTKTFP